MSFWVPPPALRRAVNPLWLPGAVATSVVLLPLLVVAAVLALGGGPRRLLRLTLFALVYVWVDVAMMVACWGLWLQSPWPARELVPWRERHAAVLRWGLDLLMAAAAALLGFRVQLEEQPGLHGSGDPLIVLARHAGPGDSFALMQVLLTAHRRRPKVVLKAALQWDPGLDILLNRLDCYFLPSSSGAGEDRTESVKELARSLSGPEALLLFPEGGNWTPHRHRRAVRWLLRTDQRRRGLEAAELTHVLPPRRGGVVACLTARADTRVVVVVHRGLDTLVNPAQMWRALPVDRRPMRIQTWVFAAADVPRDEPRARRWVDAQWARVDAWVEAPTGAPPSQGTGAGRRSARQSARHTGAFELPCRLDESEDPRPTTGEAGPRRRGPL